MADSQHTTNPSAHRVDVRASQNESIIVSTTAQERHIGALEALARLREETVRQVTKLTEKGYRKTADCDADAAGQSSGIPRFRRQVMVLMSSAAVLALETKQAIAAAAEVTIAPAAPGGDSNQLQALIDRYIEKKSIFRDLERRQNEMKKLDGLEIEDAIDEAFEDLCQVHDEIEEFEMRSMADVKLKARFAVDHLDTNEMTESAADYFAWEMLRQLAGRTGKGVQPEQPESGETCNA